MPVVSHQGRASQQLWLRRGTGTPLGRCHRRKLTEPHRRVLTVARTSYRCRGYNMPLMHLAIFMAMLFCFVHMAWNSTVARINIEMKL